MFKIRNKVVLLVHTVLELKHIQIKNDLISTRKVRGKPSIKKCVNKENVLKGWRGSI